VGELRALLREVEAHLQVVAEFTLAAASLARLQLQLLEQALARLRLRTQTFILVTSHGFTLEKNDDALVFLYYILHVKYS
jgi:hypothetical protein